MSARTFELRPMPVGFRQGRRAKQRAIIASWYARNAARLARVTLPTTPYLPRVKPWVVRSSDED